MDIDHPEARPEPPRTSPLDPRDMRLLARGSFLRGAAIAIGLLLGLPASVLLVRSLGVRGYGIYAFVISVVSFAGIVADLGIGTGVMRMASQGSLGTGARWAETGRRMSIVLGIAATGACCLVAIWFHGVERAALFLASPIALGITVRSAMSGFLVARGRMLAAEGSLALQQVSSYGPLIILSAVGVVSVVQAVGIQLASQLVAFAVILPVWTRLVRGAGPPDSDQADASLTRRLAAFSVPLVLGSLAWVAMQRSDVILLGAIRGPAAVGFYSPVLRVVDLSAIALGVLGSYYLPVTARMVETGDWERLRAMYLTVARWGIVLIGPFLGMLIALPGPVLGLLFGDSYRGAAGIARVLAAGYLVNVLTGPNGLTLVALGKTRQIAIRSVVTLTLNLAANAFLIPRYGPLGAAAGTAIAYALLNIANSFLIRREAGVHPLRRVVLGPAAAVGIGTAIGCLAVAVLGWQESVYGAVLIGAVAGVFGLAAAAATSTPERRSLTRSMLSQLRRRGDSS